MAIRTACPYCGVGCGIKAKRTGTRTVEISGDPAHPANRGKLCSKGTHLGETVGLEGRLLSPMIGEREAGWDEALDLVAARFKQTIAEHGPGSVAFYVSGQLLTEDYYVANKLMKGFIGTANIDTNSRLCMASAVAAHNRAFGEDVVPCTYDDLDESDLIVLVGSNTAWCHPVVWQRIEAARAKRGTKLVVIDPRRTETAEGADLHLPLRPDSDVELFTGLLKWLQDRGALDDAYLAAHVDVPETFRESLDQGHDLWTTARQCDVPAADLQRFFEMFAATPRALTLFSQGANQSVRGTDKGNAIINVHLATGRIGKPGSGPFSITGQPNAMGGREVGGLASTLAAHMGFSEAEKSRVQRFWNSPAIAPEPGLKAVDMFRAVADGRIKAIWVMATNPAVSLPDAGAVRDALAACPFVVVSDVIADTDTSKFAHVRLPATAWGEKDGTVTNSARTISRQRPIFEAPGLARGDWWIIDEVAKRMGFADAFSYKNPADIFREHCALSTFENRGARQFDLGEWAQISDADYDALTPTRWAGAHPFADGKFTHEGGRARLISTAPATDTAAADALPMRLNSGRYRDQWHTMTRTGLSPRLSQHRSEPLVELHPQDAEALDLAEGDLAEVETASGKSIFKVLVTDAQRRGEAFVPMHWTDGFSNGGRMGRLASPATDPVSGQPGYKNTGVRIAKANTAWRGFMVSREAPTLPDCLYWTQTRRAGGWLTEFAGNGDAEAFAEAALPDADAIVADTARGAVRRASVGADGTLGAALFLTHGADLPSRNWIAAQLDSVDAPGAAAILAGRPAGAMADPGEIVCVCFNVGINTILSAIAKQSLTSVAAIGEALSAGTNCGSCRPAMQQLLKRERQTANA